MNYLPTNIKYLRSIKRISQNTLHKEIGVERNIIGFWEVAHTLPNTEHLKILSNYFKVSIDWLVKKDLMQEHYPMIKANYQLTKQILETYEK